MTRGLMETEAASNAFGERNERRDSSSLDSNFDHLSINEHKHHYRHIPKNRHSYSQTNVCVNIRIYIYCKRSGGSPLLQFRRAWRLHEDARTHLFSQWTIFFLFLWANGTEQALPSSQWEGSLWSGTLIDHWRDARQQCHW